MPSPREKLIAELRAKIGTVVQTRVSPPVTAGDIRRWAIAVYWPETPPREFWDEELAAGTRWGGLVAPAEFNPFTWPVDPADRMIRQPRVWPGGTTFNAATDVVYGAPIRPGDVIRSTASIADIVERVGRSGPLMLYITDDVWTNQRDELIKRNRGTLIYT
jgi:hypothetical protein